MDELIRPHYTVTSRYNEPRYNETRLCNEAHSCKRLFCWLFRIRLVILAGDFLV